MNFKTNLLSLIFLVSVLSLSGCPWFSGGSEPETPVAETPAAGIRLFKYSEQSQGLRVDYKILEDLISPNEPVYSQEESEHKHAKINIFLELVIPFWIGKAASNWLIVNQEYVQDPSHLKDIDVVLCKTRRCMDLMRKYKERYSLNFRMHYIGFTSDLKAVDKPLDYNLVFHAAGKSGLKNTGAVIDTWARNPQFPRIFITCRSEAGNHGSCGDVHLSGRPHANAIPNMRLETQHLDQDVYMDMFNRAGMHVAPSAIEGFGHSVNEGRSKGAIVITTDAGPMNELVVDGETGFLVKPNSPYVFNDYSQEKAHGVDVQDLERVVEKALALPIEQKIEMGRKAREDFKHEGELFRFRMKSILDSALKGAGSSKRYGFGGRKDRFTIVSWGTDFKATGAVRALNALGFDATLVATDDITEKLPQIVEDSEYNSSVRRHYIIWWAWKEHMVGNSFDPLRALIYKTKSSSKFSNLLYNFDDPYCWLDRSYYMGNVVELFDHVFATSSERLEDYRRHGAYAHYLPPASDEETHFYEPKPHLKSDVSMVISDFYDQKTFPALVSREAIAKELCDTPGIDFALFGPPKLKEKVPNCYRGYADQMLNRQVFASSKINIATHALDGAGYMSDRVPFILMSKGLMLIDPIDVSHSLFKNGENVFVIDVNKSIAEQVNAILALPEAERDRVRANGQRLAIQKLSYRAWAKQIVETIGAI